MVQDEVRWVLDTVKDNWPGHGDSGTYGDGVYGDGLYYSSDGFPADLYRIDRDEPRILELERRSRSLELRRGNAIGVSRASRTPEPIGTEYDHRVETVVSVRLEGLHTEKSGHVESPAAFEALVRSAQHAILSERSFPTVDDVDGPVGSVDYHSLFVENEADLSHEHPDYFRRDFDVRLVGFERLETAAVETDGGFGVTAFGENFGDPS